MSFFEFPHTRTYDSDLGWLIKSMETLLKEYQSLIDYMNTHEEEYNALLRRVKALENKISKLESDINNKLIKLKRELSDEIYSQTQLVLAELNFRLSDVYVKLGNLESSLIRQRLDLEGRIEATEDFSTLYTDEKIQELINSLPDLTTINVYNPVKGYITNIQTAINDLYDLGRSEAITAMEYDSLGLSATEYDNLELTAIQYDQYGRYYLDLNGFIINPFHYMTSPFTGELVRLEVVINELASLHKDDSLTASEYDALELEALHYDSLDLTAFNYDWHSKTLVA